MGYFNNNSNYVKKNKLEIAPFCHQDFLLVEEKARHQSTTGRSRKKSRNEMRSIQWIFYTDILYDSICKTLTAFSNMQLGS